MTMLDDQLDDLLRGFRADEAVLDDDRRRRMWAEVSRTTTGAPVPLLSRRPARTRRALAAAAALVVAALAGAAVGRSTGDGTEPVTAGPADRPTASAPVAPPTLDELAATAAATSGPVLGSAPEAAYVHVVTSQVTRTPGMTDALGQVETWVALDGTGRQRAFATNGGSEADEVLDEPGSLLLAGIAPAVVVGLTDDPAEVLVAVDPDDPDITPDDMAVALVDLLALPGVPAAGRAGVLAALGDLGFTTLAGPTDDVVRIVGPGGDGTVVEAEVRREDAVVTARSATDADGTIRTTTWSLADLRPGTD